MADNYLEKRMEDYRRRGARPFRRPEPDKAAFVVDGDAATVERLRATGEWHVAFADPDVKRGRALAQRTGARHYPVDPTDADALRRAIDDTRARWPQLQVI